MPIAAVSYLVVSFREILEVSVQLQFERSVGDSDDDGVDVLVSRRALLTGVHRQDLGRNARVPGTEVDEAARRTPRRPAGPPIVKRRHFVSGADVVHPILNVADHVVEYA